MRFVVSKPADQIAAFVASRLGAGSRSWGDFKAIALVDEDRIYAGVVYNYYTGTNVCMHVGALSGRHWLTPEFLFAGFDYPFRVMGVRRVTGLVPSKNWEARRFDEALGFVYEGTMRDALADDDMLVYGMLKGECKWISSEFCGKLQRRLLRRTPASQLASA
jgi:RimJ/RimL family protein N-acetyltransferase